MAVCIRGLSGPVSRSNLSNELSCETNHLFDQTCSLLEVDAGSYISVQNRLEKAVAFSSRRMRPKRYCVHPLESVQTKCKCNFLRLRRRKWRLRTVLAFMAQTFSSSFAESGSITGLNERECGQIGVKSMHGTLGWTCIGEMSSS